MYYDNPSEGIDAASNTNAVEGVHQAVNRGALDDVDVAAPGYGMHSMRFKVDRLPMTTALITDDSFPSLKLTASSLLITIL